VVGVALVPAWPAPAVPRRQAPTEYAELRRLVEAQGLLKAQPLYYVLRTVLLAASLGLGIWLAVTLHSLAVVLLDAVFLAFLGGQVEMLGHDVGHLQVFRGRLTVRLVGLILGNVLLGVSSTWWTTKHNRHHAKPNHVSDDPDINYAMLVFSPEQIGKKARWLHPFIANQAYGVLFLLPFQPLTMRIQSIRRLRGGTGWYPYAEAVGITLNIFLCYLLLSHLGGWPTVLGFVLVHQAALGLYNGSAFAPNHKGMPVVDGRSRMSYLREQVATSRNIRGNPLTDLWFGGLNYQIEHHLFPNMPQNKLRRTQVVVRRFCEARAIAYYETGLVRSYAEVAGHLHTASASLRGG